MTINANALVVINSNTKRIFQIILNLSIKNLLSFCDFKIKHFY